MYVLIRDFRVPNTCTGAVGCCCAETSWCCRASGCHDNTKVMSAVVHYLNDECVSHFSSNALSMASKEHIFIKIISQNSTATIFLVL